MNVRALASSSPQYEWTWVVERIIASERLKDEELCAFADARENVVERLIARERLKGPNLYPVDRVDDVVERVIATERLKYGLPGIQSDNCHVVKCLIMRKEFLEKLPKSVKRTST